LYKTKGKDRICLIADSIEAKYMPDGQYSLGGQPVFVQNNAARLENGTLAGSTLKLNEGVYNFMNTLGLSLEEAVDCATINPARVLHVDDRKGSIEVGKDADLIVVDENMNVYMTICRGEVVYSKL
jgi:N-acetylglucosamine-6-phosphate deacetylase